VADRGIGISPRERRRVFETFYRSPAARRLGTRGSGLGLALVKHVLEAHGGRVELESVPGEGSTFTLVFPAARGAEAGRGGLPEGRPAESRR
jgi:signal transduction histidine kinase